MAGKAGSCKARAGVASGRGKQMQKSKCAHEGHLQGIVAGGKLRSLSLRDVVRIPIGFAC
eukprot:1997785-Amphidinium_carterae.1